MKAIIRWTLWDRRWFIFWWSLGIAGFMVINLAFYPTFRAQAAQLNQFLSHLSPATKSLIAGTGSFSTPEDFLSGRVYYLMLPLLLIILSINIGSSLIAKEENNGTLELLLARPISRVKLLLAKGIAGTVILSIVSIVALVAALVVRYFVHIGVSVLNVEVATLFAAIMGLLFGSLAFMISTIGHTARAASVGAAAFIALGSYLIVSLSSVVDWLRIPSKVLPNNYYRPNDILYGNYGWHNGVALLMVSIILAIISWRSFSNRDIGI
ncbi:MAG TPA: ABC transporter permease subunit [Candidatus Saccharimonadales bacterium]|nr:ABC transporter permease subunit [Candidatus Saccharimonadales bacterium]